MKKRKNDISKTKVHYLLQGRKKNSSIFLTKLDKAKEKERGKDFERGKEEIDRERKRE